MKLWLLSRGRPLSISVPHFHPALPRYWHCWFNEFAACPDYELTCLGNEDTSESTTSSVSADGVGVVEGAAHEGESGTAAGTPPSRTQAVITAVVSGVAGLVAASAFLLP